MANAETESDPSAWLEEGAEAPGRRFNGDFSCMPNALESDALGRAVCSSDAVLMDVRARIGASSLDARINPAAV
jgi:hypothetical protein